MNCGGVSTSSRPTIRNVRRASSIPSAEGGTRCEVGFVSSSRFLGLPSAYRLRVTCHGTTPRCGHHERSVPYASSISACCRPGVLPRPLRGSSVRGRALNSRELPPIPLSIDEIHAWIDRSHPLLKGAGTEKVMARGKMLKALGAFEPTVVNDTELERFISSSNPECRYPDRRLQRHTGGSQAPLRLPLQCWHPPSDRRCENSRSRLQ